jgi:hypothetical protein
MTMTEPVRDTRDTARDTDLSDEKARLLARAAWHESGGKLTGKELAERFGRSAKWGQNQAAAARKDAEERAATAGGSVPRHEPAARPAVPAPRAAARPEAPPAARPKVNGTPRPPASTAPAARHWVDTVTVLAVALVAAAASYGHMLEVAQLAGEPVWLARAFPITVDGLALAALRRGTSGRWWLVFALAVSVAGNVLAQFPAAAATAGPAVSAWPPLALYGTHRLLHGGGR